MTKIVKLVLMRGYPASGKTTFAKAWIKEKGNRIRVNRDDLRQMLFGYDGVGTQNQESVVTDVQRKIITNSLQKGISVIVDDTNLVRRNVRVLKQIADKHDAKTEIIDCDTDFEACINRDKDRMLKGHRGVGEDVIRRFAERFPLENWVGKDPFTETPGDEESASDSGTGGKDDD